MLREIGTEDFYKLLHPRPVVVIITVCPGGRVNAMSASWVMPVSEEPPTVALAIDAESYTVECLKYCSELSINVPSIEHADLVYALGSTSGREVDKVSKYGLRLGTSDVIRAPYWLDAIGVIEGRVAKEVRVGEVILYVVEVIKVRAKEELFSRWGWDLSKAKPLQHVVGRAFTTVSTRKIIAKRT